MENIILNGKFAPPTDMSEEQYKKLILEFAKQKEERIKNMTEEDRERERERFQRFKDSISKNC